MISAENIEKQLKKPLFVTVCDCVESTNLSAHAAAKDGAASGTVIIALRQTAGRGRLGRSFFSPTGGLYISVILRPNTDPAAALSITTAAAVAVCRALDEFTVQKATVKWVNDIYLGDRKVCGILNEGVFLPETGKLDYAVLGIGLNLTEPAAGYPPEIVNRAGAVFGKEAVTDAQKEQIAAKVLNGFFELFDENAVQNGLDEYRRRSYLDGKTVTYVQNGVTHTARVSGVDEQVRLVLEENGKTVTLGAGEVSVCPTEE